jgi:hypothetical protein
LTWPLARDRHWPARTIPFDLFDPYGLAFSFSQLTVAAMPQRDAKCFEHKRDNIQSPFYIKRHQLRYALKRRQTEESPVSAYLGIWLDTGHKPSD